MLAHGWSRNDAAVASRVVELLVVPVAIEGTSPEHAIARVRRQRHHAGTEMRNGVSRTDGVLTLREGTNILDCLQKRIVDTVWTISMVPSGITSAEDRSIQKCKFSLALAVKYHKIVG